MLYVGDTPAGGGWRDVFLADTSKPDQPTVFTAGAGRLVIDREKRTVDLVLTRMARGTRPSLTDPAKYEVARFARIDPRARPQQRVPRHRDPEGRQRDDDARAPGPGRRTAAAGPVRCTRPYGAAPQVRAAVRVLRVRRSSGWGSACSTAAAASSAAFVPGIAVVFVYYIIEYRGRQMAKGQVLPPWLAVWAPNIVLGAAGVALLLWRARSADKPHPAHAARRGGRSGRDRARPTGATRRHEVAHGRRRDPPAGSGICRPFGCSTRYVSKPRAQGRRR